MEYPELHTEVLAMLNDAGCGDDKPTRRTVAKILNALASRFDASSFLVTRDRIQRLACNLHNPRPPAPTLAEAREAARQLGGPSADIVHRFLDTLQGAE
jgi:hypothetical protein